ncbi:UNVERIFIED_CONTAM: hypothetical protein Slati_3398200 [Sesamum latifolium]|uniref:Uncharacterized protein n=1 Tax=Sesamum latifolium TaxID=2727402 RepID=A0AAW2UET9_9LAMI
MIYHKDIIIPLRFISFKFFLTIIHSSIETNLSVGVLTLCFAGPSLKFFISWSRPKLKVQVHRTRAKIARINWRRLWEHRVQDVSFHGDSKQSRKQAKCRRDIRQHPSFAGGYRMPPTSASGGSTPAASAPRIPPPGVVGPVADPLWRSTSSDTFPKDYYLSSRPNFNGPIIIIT